MILTVCMSPCVDVTVELDALNVGKTNVVKGKSLSLGGKALNVAVGIARLGVDVHATGIMYEDNGYMFEKALKYEGVDFSFVWNKGRVRENYKFIDNRSMLTEVNDVGQPVPKEKTDEVLALVKKLSANSGVTVISGGLPRGTEDGFYGELVRAVDPRSLRVVDATGKRLFSAIEQGVDLVKPNLEELENAMGRRITDKNELLSACYELIDRGAKRVLLSLGRKGAVITDGTRNFYCKSINVAVNSTVGAGDSMVAATSVLLEKGAGLKELLLAGIAGGTASVMNSHEHTFEKETYEDVLSKLEFKEI